mmetsp:Transcript_53722/g.109506  ORF Transcript_53722/g.109506 Transcript_53722/m.109506 type:complete len:550 (-) Transcript_53722:20-1669(-)
MEELLRAVGLQPDPDPPITPKLHRIIEGKVDEKVVDIPSFLEQANVGVQWVVAYAEGGYLLRVARWSVRLSVVPPGAIKKVLSHRWHPSIRTTMGPIPQQMLESEYPEPTWVDFLNHFNLPQYTVVVVSKMGDLYAKKHCRAVYLERGRTFEGMAEAISRTWMWQELAAGPQDHRYCSAEAVWLHFVIMVGELSALTTASSGEGKFDKVRDQFDKLGGGNAGGCSEEAREEFNSGTARPLLAAVFRDCGFVNCDPAVRALVEALGPDAATTKGAAAEAAKMLWWSQCTVLKCCRAVYKARDISNENVSQALSAFQTASNIKGLVQGSREGTLDLSHAVMVMLMKDQDQTAYVLTSAVANLSNRNVTVSADRLVASFGVLCARRGVACEASVVSAMIFNADAVVLCLRASEALGVAAASRRRVHVDIAAEGQESAAGPLGKVGEGLVGTVTGIGWVEQNRCDVTVSGLPLGRCKVRSFAGGIGAQLDVTKWFSAQKGAGEIVSYELKDGGLVTLHVALETGGMMIIFNEDGSTMPGGEEFRRWWVSLEEA